jgi:hypothetical protein
MMRRFLCVGLTILLAAVGVLPVCAEADGDSTRTRGVTGRLYLDFGYLRSSTRPGNHTWRSKGTTSTIDRLKVNNATFMVQKETSPESRWGFLAGVQGGVDINGLVPSSPVSDAEDLKHLYYTNVSYLFPAGNGLTVTGGLIPGHIGYESFHAIDNPNYTRIYGVDYVPYFEWGVQAAYPFSDSFEGALLVVNGYDYLSSPNSVPSYGLQATVRVADNTGFRQNFYYGPEQGDTSLEYWRFVSNTIAQWNVGRFTLLGTVGFGTEKQTGLAGTPRYDWAWGALWIKWRPTDAWRAAVRPEFFKDSDGLMTGARQKIYAITGSLEYRLSPIEMNALSARLEYRFDRSTGPDGGFYEGSDNILVANQHLVMVSVMVLFDTASRRRIGTRPEPVESVE